MAASPQTNDSDWRRLDDDLKLVRWRTDRLLALGYPLREAASLALSDVDVHELEHLIAKGCTTETAARIAA
jgi:hypothetical protein